MIYYCHRNGDLNCYKCEFQQFQDFKKNYKKVVLVQGHVMVYCVGLSMVLATKGSLGANNSFEGFVKFAQNIHVFYIIITG